MKRTLLIAAALCVAGWAGFAAVLKPLAMPQDDPPTHQAASERAEVKPLADELWDLVENRICPLRREGIDKVFGPKLDNPPKDMVLPVFAPDSIILDGAGQPELHAIGNLGYLECYYQNYNASGSVMQWAWYHRADGKFVPLKSADDFAKRLEWDQAKLAEIRQWLDGHLPKYKDLGLVKISAAAPSRLALGTGRDCIFTVRIFTVPDSTNFAYHATVTDDSGGVNPGNRKGIRTPITGSNAVVGFSVDDVLYNATLQLVESPFKDLGVVELAERVPSVLELGAGRECSVTANTLADGRVSLNFRFNSGGGYGTWVSKPGGSVCFTTGGEIFKLTPAVKAKAVE